MPLTRFLSITVALALALPGAAFAAGPVALPEVIVDEGFESPTSTAYDAFPTRTGAAYWGAVTSSKRTGSYGLWCAGTGGTWPLYPKGSAGHADFDLGAAIDFYSLDRSEERRVGQVCTYRWSPDQ